MEFLLFLEVFLNFLLFHYNEQTLKNLNTEDFPVILNFL